MILIAGPCVIESREQILKIATHLQKYAKMDNVEFYFKASFDKANRTSISSYRGPGLDEGLKILSEVKKEFNYKILTDIHESYQAAPVANVADVLQIPAFLCRQTDLLIAAAKTNAKINIKKGQFLAPQAMKHSVQKALETRGIKDAPSYEISAQNGVYLCERGSSFGYSNLVVDMRSLSIMREYAPVIFDATHSVQMPAGASDTSGGDSRFVPLLARAAAAVGVDGFFYETHYDPSKALSDGANMLSLERVDESLKQVFAIKKALADLI